MAKGVFTGAYVIKDFEPGVRAFCTRNPNYFKSDRGWFDEVEILGISADLSAASDKIGHDKLAANWELDGFRAPERWWFKS